MVVLALAFAFVFALPFRSPAQRTAILKACNFFDSIRFVFPRACDFFDLIRFVFLSEA